MLSIAPSATSFPSKTQIIAQNHSLTTNFQPKAKNNISFGDDGPYKTYSYKSAYADLAKEGIKIEDDQPEPAFSRLYKIVQTKLEQKRVSEALKEQQQKNTKVLGFNTESGREYKVDSDMPCTEEKFVEVLSRFTREEGNNPGYMDKYTGIDNYLVNKLKLPKSRFWQYTDFDVQKAILINMYDFFQKGLVNIKNLKK